MLCTREPKETEAESAELGKSGGPGGDMEPDQQAASCIDDSNEGKDGKKRLFHVDFARICAVMCVIFEHSGR